MLDWIKAAIKWLTNILVGGSKKETPPDADISTLPKEELAKKILTMKNRSTLLSACATIYVRIFIVGTTISSFSYVGYDRRPFSKVSSEKEMILSRFWKSFSFSSYLYVFLHLWKQRVLRLFPFLKRISPQVSIYISLFSYLICLKIFYSLGSLLMDELQRAVAPFLHTSGGMNEGGFSQPPTPTPPPENSGLGLIPGAESEEDRPDPNHYASQEAHQGDASKKKLFTVLKKHLRKYCASQAVAEKYPYLKDLKEEDFNYFAHHIAITELDIDESKPNIEIADLANYIKNYNTIKTVFDFFFENYYKNDA